jgi:hypothetical protein
LRYHGSAKTGESKNTVKLRGVINQTLLVIR